MLAFKRDKMIALSPPFALLFFFFVFCICVWWATNGQTVVLHEKEAKMWRKSSSVWFVWLSPRCQLCVCFDLHFFPWSLQSLLPSLKYFVTCTRYVWTCYAIICLTGHEIKRTCKSGIMQLNCLFWYCSWASLINRLFLGILCINTFKSALKTYLFNLQ